MVTSPLKTPRKLPSPSKGESDREISMRSNSGAERGEALTVVVGPGTSRRSDRVDGLYNIWSNIVDMGCNEKGEGNYIENRRKGQKN